MDTWFNSIPSDQTVDVDTGEIRAVVPGYYSQQFGRFVCLSARLCFKTNGGNISKSLDSKMKYKIVIQYKHVVSIKTLVLVANCSFRSVKNHRA